MLSQLQKAIELERLPTALRIGSDGTGVTDTFSVHVGASSLTVLLGPLPASSDLDTVAVELPPTARREWFRPIEPYMGSPAWFRLLLGQQCTVTTKTRVVNGLLRHQDKDEIMLQKDDMLHSVSMASMVTFSVQLPAAAVNQGPKGAFVYVVGANDTVIAQPVSLVTTQGATSVVQAPLKSGQLVVTDGQMSLRPGLRVRYDRGVASTRHAA